ncbi:PAS domain-containing protein [Streptomyces sp. H27-D2]|uniref:PAS domain-containing protein n=1 Tax=Streptomyces sp. H27-D2 TaxID=3046304 RepID=UPI002DBC8160|nr:PAS domain-containing protein [Streptomyces sp. H27-D2]MEC4016821.1 PAS domain-containing protein [Streptomyces sp. H27-D2]
MTPSQRSGATHSAPSDGDDSDLLAALLDGMDAALCAFDAEGVVTHWNREAEHILGWSAKEAVGRPGLAGWAVRSADADEVQARLLGAMHAPGRQVHEFALLTKDGGRVLVRTQSAGVRGADGRPAGVYCAFSEVHTQIDLERSIALSEALFEDASWGVVLVDADLRPAVVNAFAARALGAGRTKLLGRPLGELLDQGVEELESALQHVLAQGAPPAPIELWVTLRDDGGGGEAGGSGGSGGVGGVGRRRCWRSSFLRLASPLAEEPVPLGVSWFFHDVTEVKGIEQQGSQLRFRGNQLYRAGRSAAECEDPMEAATVYLDFALVGFADHALIDLVFAESAADVTAQAEAAPPAADEPRSPVPDADAAAGAALGDAADSAEGPLRLVRAAATPVGSPGPCLPIESTGIPLRYPDGHPALLAVERCGSVRAASPTTTTARAGSGSGAGAGSADGGSAGSTETDAGAGAGTDAGAGAGTDAGAAAAAAPPADPGGWAAARKWPYGTVYGLCVVLRSRGRTLGVATFLRGPTRRAFDRSDAVYAEDVAVRVAAALDLALSSTSAGVRPGVPPTG